METIIDSTSGATQPIPAVYKLRYYSKQYDTVLKPAPVKCVFLIYISIHTMPYPKYQVTHHVMAYGIM